MTYVDDQWKVKFNAKIGIANESSLILRWTWSWNSTLFTRGIVLLFVSWFVLISQPAFTCLKSTMESSEQCVKYVQAYQ